jgi:hypothetical protein
MNSTVQKIGVKHSTETPLRKLFSCLQPSKCTLKQWTNCKSTPIICSKAISNLAYLIMNSIAPVQWIEVMHDATKTNKQTICNSTPINCTNAILNLTYAFDHELVAPVQTIEVMHSAYIYYCKPFSCLQPTKCTLNERTNCKSTPVICSNAISNLAYLIMNSIAPVQSIEVMHAATKTSKHK